MPPLPCSSPGYQFWTVEYLISRVVERDEFDDRRVELVFIPHRRRAAFEIADVRALVGDDERALKLAGVGGIDAEIGRKLHRAAHAFGDVTKRTVGENGGVQRGKKIIRVGHDHAEIFADEIGMLLHRLAERTENDALFGELLFERGADGNGIKHRVHGHAGEPLAFAQRDAKLFIGLQQFRINLIEAFRPVALFPGRGVVNDVLIIDFFVVNFRPGWLLHGLPVPERLEPPVGQPDRLVFAARNQPDGALAQARRRGVGFHVGVEPVFVFLFDQAFNGLGGGAHGFR